MNNIIEKYQIDFEKTKKLIRCFKVKINEYPKQDYLIMKHASNPKLNHWSQLCSAADWLEVSFVWIVEALKRIDLDNENADIVSFNIFNLISAIALSWDSIKTINKIITNEPTPLNEKRDVFSNKVLETTDNFYFKEIRAAFGAYPINLNMGPKESQLIAFASWPVIHLPSDLAVGLYVQNKTKDYRIFNIYISELIDFINQRFHYISDIIDYIDSDFEKHVEEMKQQSINLTVTKDNLDFAIKKLKAENNQRYNISYYRDLLDEIQLYIKGETNNVQLMELLIRIKTEMENMVLENNPDHSKILDEIVNK